MKDLAKISLQEIALEGEMGCSLLKLFELLLSRKEELFDSLDAVFDDSIKEYMWKYISKLPDIHFLVIKDKRSEPPQAIYEKSQIQNMTLSQLHSNYGTQLRIATTEERRKLACFGFNDPSIRISPLQFNVLSLISKYRSVGITQADISKLLSIDPKSVFHYIKVLGEMKLIVKMPIISKGTNTLLIILARFAEKNMAYLEQIKKNTDNSESKITYSYQAPKISVDSRGQSRILVSNGSSTLAFHSELIREKICLMVSQAKNQIMASEDVFQSLDFEKSEIYRARRWFNRNISFLSNDGFIEIVHVSFAQSSENSKQKLERCIRFLKSYDSPKSNTTGFEKTVSSQKYASKMALESDIVGEGGALVDFSLEWQVFRLICISGSAGITTSTIRRSLNNMGVKMLMRILERFLKMNGPEKGMKITRVQESFGRERRFRYFANKKAIDKLDHFPDISIKSANQSLNVHIEEVKTPVSNSSVSSFHRRNVVLSLLEEKKILETGVPLIKLYQDYLERQGQKPLFNIDKKTLQTVYNGLQDDGLLTVHTFKIPNFSGSYNTKSLLLHKSLKGDDKSVKQYIRQLEENTLLYGSSSSGIKYPPKREWGEDISVERIELKKKKIESSTLEPAPLTGSIEIYRGESFSDKNEAMDPFALASSSTSSNLPDFLNSNNWKITAQSYGFVTAKMVRAQLLHEWLLSVMIKPENSENDHPYVNNGVFSAYSLFRDMPFELYLKIVGLLSLNATMKEFLENHEYENTPMSNLPHHIRAILAVRAQRQRQLLSQTLEILEILHVVKSQVNPDESNVSRQGANQMKSNYRLEWNVPFYDQGSDINPLIRYYEIRTKEDLSEYWINLEMISTNNKSQQYSLTRNNSVEPLSDDVEAVDDETTASSKLNMYSVTVPSITKGKLEASHQIMQVKNWKYQTPFTKEQKLAIERYVDRSNGTTPLYKEDQCKEIAKSVGITVPKLKLYFRRVEDTYHRKLILSKQRSRELLLQKTIDRTRTSKIIDENNLPTSIYQNGIDSNHAKEAVKKLIAKSSKRRTIEEPGRQAIRKSLISSTTSFIVDQGENIPLIEDVEQFKNVLGSTSKQRSNWTEREHDLLLYGLAVISHEKLRTRRFIWKPILILLPHRDSSLCRRRFEILLRNPETKSRYDKLLLAWPAIYEKGLDENAFSQDTNYETMEYQKMVDYFIENTKDLTTEETSNSYMELHQAIPERLPDILSKYTLKVEKRGFDFKARNTEEQFFVKSSIVSKMELMYSFPLTCQLYRVDDSDKSFSSDSDLNEDIIENNVIISTIKMILMTPESKYDDNLAYQMLDFFAGFKVEIAIQELIREGMISKVKGGTDRRLPGRGFQLSDKFLSALAGRFPDRLIPQAICYSNVLKEHEFSKFEFSPFINSGGMACLLNSLATKRIKLEPLLPMMPNEDEIRKDYVFGINIVSLKKMDLKRPSNVSESIESVKKLCSSGSPKKITTINPQNDKTQNKILELICNRGILGISKYELKEIIINEKVKECEYESIIREMLALSLISQVGFSEFRYVDIKHEDKWKIFIIKGSEKQSCVARMWFDINGDLVAAILRACMEAVLSIIQMKPGISEAKLYVMIKSVMTRVEVLDLLEIMISKGILRKRIVKKPMPIKSGFDIFADRERESGEEVACYWPESDWFLKTR